MFRKALLPALALAMLSGCATDYSYRGGNGDYYYGQPQVEYRYIGGYGGYGSYDGYSSYGGYGGYGYGLGGYGRPVYYYDRYGRLVYGHPYSHFGTPYSGGYWPYRPRQTHGGGHHHHDDDRNAGDNRLPPWRNIGGMRPGMPESRVDARDDDGLRRQPTPFAQPVPRAERVIAPASRSGGDAGVGIGNRSSSSGERARDRTSQSAED